MPESALPRMSSIPPTYVHLMSTVPREAVPLETRISAAFHIRREFIHFENGTDANDPAYLAEIYGWANSSEAQMVFTELVNKLVADLPLLAALKSRGPRSSTEGDTVLLVYICSDNNHIKHVLASKVAAACSNTSFSVRVMYLDSPLTHHSKNRLVFVNGQLKQNDLFDLSFDWYALSLANYVYAWRKDGLGGSTFVGSAVRTAGDQNKTDVGAELGQGGIHTKKFQYGKNKKGNFYTWTQEWSYSFLDEYDSIN